jgi:hypothetical protein
MPYFVWEEISPLVKRNSMEQSALFNVERKQPLLDSVRHDRNPRKHLVRFHIIGGRGLLLHSTIQLVPVAHEYLDLGQAGLHLTFEAFLGKTDLLMKMPHFICQQLSP